MADRSFEFITFESVHESESAIMAEYASLTNFDQIDNAAIRMAKKSLLDGLGVMLAASGLCDNCRPFVEMALEQCGKKESRILGYRESVTANMAAFANGALAHALDFEDAHDTAFVHPNAALIPSALAISESISTVSGKEFIAAMAVGCDLVCRLGMAFKKNPIEFGWYIPPVLGAFGAAAAVGRLLHLDKTQMLNAFALTLCQATCTAQLRYSPHSDIRAVRDAFAAHAGIVAAKLAKKGVKGFDQPFEGKAGLFQLYARGNYNRFTLIENIGKKFEGARISFKPWPTCRGTHTYIEAALTLRKKYDIEVEKIKGIYIRVSPLNQMLCEPIEIKQKPATSIDGKFSLPFVIGIALTHGEVKLDQFTADALKDTKVLQVASKVTYDVEPEVEAQNVLEAYMEIHMLSGEVYSKKVKTAYGHPDCPISDADLEKKFLTCAAQAKNQIPEKKIVRVMEIVLNLENINSMTQLTDCF